MMDKMYILGFSHGAIATGICYLFFLWRHHKKTKEIKAMIEENSKYADQLRFRIDNLAKVANFWRKKAQLLEKRIGQ